MKMGFLFSGIFWGIVLVLVGLSIILKSVLGIDIPLFRIIVAFVLIYLGITLFLGKSCCSRTCVSKRVFRGGPAETESLAGEYDVVFGNAFIDASTPLKDEKDEKMKVDVVFGSSTIKVSPDIPTTIKGSSAFGSIRFPDGTNIAFGDHTYNNKAFSDSVHFREIEVDVVFGSVRIIE